MFKKDEKERERIERILDYVENQHENEHHGNSANNRNHGGRPLEKSLSISESYSLMTSSIDNNSI